MAISLASFFSSLFIPEVSTIPLVLELLPLPTFGFLVVLTLLMRFGLAFSGAFSAYACLSSILAYFSALALRLSSKVWLSGTFSSSSGRLLRYASLFYLTNASF
jgi:hypothetical protein